MDKRKVYGVPGELESLWQVTFCTEKCAGNDCRHTCVEYVLCDTAELAKVEAQAARVPELEAKLRGALVYLEQYAEALEMAMESDAVEEVTDLIVEANQVITPESVAKTNDYLPTHLLGTLANLTDNLESTLRAVSEVRKANEGVLPALDRICGIFKPTEAEIKREEYARIGRAVEDYANRHALFYVQEVIAKAREGKS